MRDKMRAFTVPPIEKQSLELDVVAIPGHGVAMLLYNKDGALIAAHGTTAAGARDIAKSLLACADGAATH